MRLLLPILFVFFTSPLMADICYSTGDGNWNDPNTWSCLQVPAGGDVIYIMPGDVIAINSSVVSSGLPMYVSNQGDIVFSGTGSLTLPLLSGVLLLDGASVYESSTGVFCSRRITVGFDNVWCSSDGLQSGAQAWGIIPSFLPVELSSFKGTSNGNYTELVWKTSKEINHKGFVVERSNDGKTWKSIAALNAKNAATGSTYQYKDISPLFGKGYYRLRMEGYDNTVEYSQVVAVESIEAQPISIYPSNPQLAESIWLEGNFSGESIAQVWVMTIDGKMVSENHYVLEKGMGRVLLNDMPMKSGLYMLKVNVGESFFSTKVLID